MTNAIERAAPTPPPMRLEPRNATELMRLAEVLARAQGGPNSVPDIVAAALRGERHGWGVVHSCDSYHIIQGQPTMKPEAMLGIIRAAGHSVQIELGDGSATVTGKRADTGDSITTTFTVADAQRIGLAKGAAWKNYPQQMCQWRAVSQMAKALFSDLLAGYYTPEELGAAVDADGEVTDLPDEPLVVDAEIVEPTLDVAAAKNALIDAFAGIYDSTEGCERDATLDAAALWSERTPSSDDELADLIGAAIEQARAHVAADADGEAVLVAADA